MIIVDHAERIDRTNWQSNGLSDQMKNIKQIVIVNLYKGLQIFYESTLQYTQIIAKLNYSVFKSQAKQKKCVKCIGYI
ncbi:hypothetical protein pb186bvf_004994 [Paramecium bursaria]